MGTRDLSVVGAIVALALAQLWGAAPSVPAQARRDPAVEFVEIVKWLELKTGDVVADVGAGGGGWAFRLARHVGPDGHVFATEIRRERVTGLSKAFAALGLRNATAVLGTEKATGLPEQCCNAALLRLVYHAFDLRAEMRRSLAHSLMVGGRVLVVDFEPSLNALLAEMAETGLEPVATIPSWQGQVGVYAAVFVRRPQAPTSP